MNPFPLTLLKNCNENMKTFRIVSELVDIEEYKDRPVSTVERYRIEQQYHFMGIFHFWKTPKFAANELFLYPNVAEHFVWSYYPDAVIL